MRLKKSKWSPEEYLELYGSLVKPSREIKTVQGEPFLTCPPTDKQMRYLIENKVIRPHIRSKELQHWIAIGTVREISGMLGIKPSITAADSKTYYQNRFGYFHNVSSCNAYRQEGQDPIKPSL